MTRPQPVIPAVEASALSVEQVQLLIDMITLDVQRCDAMSAFPGYASEAAALRTVLATLAGMCIAARAAQS